MNDVFVVNNLTIYGNFNRLRLVSYGTGSNKPVIGYTTGSHSLKFISGYKYIHIENIDFSLNAANSDNIMLLISESGTSYYIKNCRFNGFGGHGGKTIGFMCAHGASGTLYNCSFRDLRTATWVGYSSTMTLENCTKIDNSIGYVVTTGIGGTAFVKPSTFIGVYGAYLKDPASVIVGLT